MRIAILLTAFLFVLLVACSPVSETKEPKFAVGLYNLNISDSVDSQGNVTSSLSFELNNQEDFDLDCKVFLKIANGSESDKKLGNLGLVKARESKPGAFTFEMLDGDSSVNLEPLCNPTTSD